MLLHTIFPILLQIVIYNQKNSLQWINKIIILFVLFGIQCLCHLVCFFFSFSFPFIAFSLWKRKESTGICLHFNSWFKKKSHLFWSIRVNESVFVEFPRIFTNENSKNCMSYEPQTQFFISVISWRWVVQGWRAASFFPNFLLVKWRRRTSSVYILNENV